MKNKENKEEMNIKIQNSGTGGASDCKGSCSDLAHYINHEDQERIDEGLDPLPMKLIAINCRILSASKPQSHEKAFQ